MPKTAPLAIATSSGILLALCSAIVLGGQPAIVAPVSIEQSASDLPGRSPYEGWPQTRVAVLPAEAMRLEEIHPDQAAWISAAYGNEDYRSAAHCRAGWPECIRQRATPSNTPHDCGYWVGGGAAWHGQGRLLDEGTFGWDYFGLTSRKRVALGWWHGRQQGGLGAYPTDGPQVLHRE
jgi:hypothetical protein